MVNIQDIFCQTFYFAMNEKYLSCGFQRKINLFVPLSDLLLRYLKAKICQGILSNMLKLSYIKLKSTLIFEKICKIFLYMYNTQLVILIILLTYSKYHHFTKEIEKELSRKHSCIFMYSVPPFQYY